MKKHFKKSLILSLCFVFAFMTSTPIFAAEDESDYSTHWAKEHIQLAIDKGEVTGYADGTFKPDQSITRAEFVKIVNQKFELDAIGVMNYSDVATSEWYAGPINVATTSGYIQGYTDQTFKPNGNLTRQEAALIFNNLNELTATSTSADFSDASTIAEWAKEAIIAVSENNIMIGYPDGSFKANNEITRAEAIIAISRSFSYSDTLTDESTAPVVTDPVITDPVIVDPVEPISPVVSPVALGMAGDYVILSKTGISTVPNSSITGHIGVSPIGATAITGFSLTADSTNVFSTSDQVTGKVYASNYTTPTPSNLTTAISNMETAYTDAAGRAADYTELHSGDLSGKTLTPGVYKWETGVIMTSDVTLEGDSNSVFIFQIGGGITQSSGVKIILKGGLQAKNIIWQTAQTVSIGTGAHFEGIVLSQTDINLGTGASMNGRLLAQTAVTLDQNVVVEP